jgi:hypothetical protein
MLFRLLSFAVIIGHLAGQLAAIPHAHAGNRQNSEQGSAPHFHLSFFSENHSHDQCHGSHGHDHGDAKATHGLVDVESPERGAIAADHDADAVYVSEGVTSSPRDQQGCDLLTYSQLTSAFMSLNSGTNVTGFQPLFAFDTGANSSAWHCARYLQLGTLRI